MLICAKSRQRPPTRREGCSPASRTAKPRAGVSPWLPSYLSHPSACELRPTPPKPSAAPGPDHSSVTDRENWCSSCPLTLPAGVGLWEVSAHKCHCPHHVRRSREGRAVGTLLLPTRKQCSRCTGGSAAPRTPGPSTVWRGGAETGGHPYWERREAPVPASPRERTHSTPLRSTADGAQVGG